MGILASKANKGVEVRNESCLSRPLTHLCGSSLTATTLASVSTVLKMLWVHMSRKWVRADRAGARVNCTFYKGDRSSFSILQVPSLESTDGM